jgi:hypothetical protein
LAGKGMKKFTCPTQVTYLCANNTTEHTASCATTGNYVKRNEIDEKNGWDAEDSNPEDACGTYVAQECPNTPARNCVGTAAGVPTTKIDE